MSLVLLSFVDETLSIKSLYVNKRLEPFDIHSLYSDSILLLNDIYDGLYMKVTSVIRSHINGKTGLYI